MWRFGTDYGTPSHLFVLLFPVRFASAIWVIMPVICILLFLNFCSNKISIKESFREKRINLAEGASEKELQILTFVVLAIASWHQYYPKPCINHMFWAAGFMTGIFVYFFWEIINLKNIIKKSVCLGLVILFFFFTDITQRVVGGINRYNTFPVTIDYGFHLNGMRVTESAYHFFRAYFEFVEQLKEMFPGKHFINYTTCGFWGITFPGNLTNMTHNWGDFVYPGYSENIRKLMERYRPIVVSYTELNAPSYVEFARLGSILFFAHEDDIAILFGEQ